MASPISQGSGREAASARPGLKPTSCRLAARLPQRPDVAVVAAAEVVVPQRPERPEQPERVVQPERAAQPLNPEHFRLSLPCSHGRQKNRRK